MNLNILFIECLFIHQVPVYPPFEPVCSTDPQDMLQEMAFYTVDIRVERFTYNRRYSTDEPVTKPFFIVENYSAELAHMLTPAYLDGQISDVKRREREEFFAGFVSGMKRVMG